MGSKRRDSLTVLLLVLLMLFTIVPVFIPFINIPSTLAVPYSDMWQVSHSDDDSYERGTGDTYPAESIYLIWSHTDDTDVMYRCAGVRFQTVTIPQGATISSAKLSIATSGSGGQSANFKVFGNNIDTALNFTEDTDVIGRDRTSANTSFVQALSDSTWYNISVGSIIQEIVDRGGWSSGNDLALLLIANTDITGNWTSALSYDINPAASAKLYIDWIASDTSQPTIQNIGTNTTWAGHDCNFTAEITDNWNLTDGGCYLSNNNTGVWSNETFISFNGPGQSYSELVSNIIALNSNVGQVIGCKYYFNDTEDNWGVSSEITFILTGGLEYDAVDQNTTTAGEIVNATLSITDDVELSHYVIRINNGSGYTNYTYPILGSVNNYFVSETWRLNVTLGTLSGWEVLFNDTSNNWNATGVHEFLTTNASTFSAWDGTATKIQEAVDDAEAYSAANSARSWVYIPTGTWQLTHPNVDGTLVTIEIPEYGMTVYGAGIANTILYLPENNSAANSIMFKVTGEWGGGLKNGSFQFRDIHLRGREPYATCPIGDTGLQLISAKNFRVSNCNFSLMGGTAVHVYDADSTYGTLGGDWDYISYGLVDQCEFYNIYKPAATDAARGYGYGVSTVRAYSILWSTKIYPAGNGTKINDPWGEEDSWYNAIGQFEGPWPTFGSYKYNTYVEDCYFYNTRHAGQAFGGGAYVFRYSVVEDQTIESSFTGHPNRGTDPDTGNQASFSYELYETTINDTDGGQDFYGPLIEGGAALAYNNTIDNLGYWAIVGGCEYASLTTHPLGHTNNVFLWDNTVTNSGGLLELDNTGMGGDAPILNTDYFLYEPNGTHVYTPFTYPHPIVTGGPGVNFHYSSTFKEEQTDTINITVGEWTSGVSSLKNLTITINTLNDNENFTLAFDFNTGIFSEISDSNNICTLNTDSSSNVSWPDGYESTVVFNFTIDAEALDGVCDLNVTVFDDEDKSDTRTWNNVFMLNKKVWKGKAMNILDPYKILGILTNNVIKINKIK